MGAMWLDLFAGTGNVSLEALSRGALRVVSVDREPACIKNIHRNLAHLGFEDRARVIKADILKPLDFLLSYSDNEGYDIIFMGPPYRDLNNKMLSLSEPALKNVAEAKLLARAICCAGKFRKIPRRKIRRYAGTLFAV